MFGLSKLMQEGAFGLSKLIREGAFGLSKLLQEGALRMSSRWLEVEESYSLAFVLMLDGRPTKHN